MFARLSVAAAVALVAALCVSSVEATFSQGGLNFTRDYIIEWSTSSYADTEAFCKDLREGCVDYAGPLGQHHQLDCVFDSVINGVTVVQEGPKIHAFCGGLPKNPDGTWTDGGFIIDHTETVVEQYTKATIISKPLTKAACQSFAKKHKAVTC
ncbi:hypothetical protein JCM5296_000632 [Sporobolomyces johnsonii]